MSIVTVQNLTKVYPAFKLDRVSFSLEPGRITGFIGRNGAGKTTTIKSMLNLVRPDEGEITYFGKNLYGNEAEIKSRIGYSTGSVNWYPRKKIRDLIGVERRFFANTWDEKKCAEYMTAFALDENKTPLELSDGMKVKCNLMLALSHRAELLILDEPTSGLDPFSRDELTEVFEELKRQGVSVFFSTHIITDLEKCADDIIYISGGKIVSALPKDEFCAAHGREDESLEDTFLRLEKEARHA